MRIINNKHEVQKVLDSSYFQSIFSFDAEPFIKLIHFDVDDEITMEGEVPEHLFYLVSGQAKLFITLPNGKRTLIDFFNASCFIGEMELLGVHTQSRSVQALVPCVCLALPLKSCRSQLLNDARFLRKLSLYLGNKNMRNVVSLAETKTYPPNQSSCIIHLISGSKWTLQRNARECGRVFRCIVSTFALCSRRVRAERLFRKDK